MLSAAPSVARYVDSTTDALFYFVSLQRGSEELAMSNGAVLSPQSNHADNNNDAKKVSCTLVVVPADGRA